MQRERAEFDADRQQVVGPTKHKTSQNIYELQCGTCGAMYFVDRATHDRIEHAIEEGLEDNPFVCSECEAEYEAESYGG